MEQRRHDAAVAHDEGAGKTSIPDDELLVNSSRRLGITDDLVVFLDCVLLAHYREIDARDFQLGGQARSHIYRVRVSSGQTIGQDLRLLP